MTLLRVLREVMGIRTRNHQSVSLSYAINQDRVEVEDKFTQQGV
jgi:hypothetical protein